ncbi:MAG: glycosyltransferase [Solirubrobacterales bacterium]
MRILLVSQFYPGPNDPDLGAFVAQMSDALERRGNVIERVAIDSRGGSRVRHLKLGTDAVAAARRFNPDVIYAHFLVPAGAMAALASFSSKTPLVLTAHGQDVRNLGSIPGIRQVTAATVKRAGAVICVSDYLRRELVARVPAAGPKSEVIDSGVDLERFAPADQAQARQELGLDADGPLFLFVGSLDENKNVVRLAEAYGRIGSGSLVMVGDGPLRAQVEAMPGVKVVGRVPHDQVPRWMAAADIVCQPSIVESFGQATLEAMACARTVVATENGGPPEFVTPEAGVLVDPQSTGAILEGLSAAATLPSPNPAAREAAEGHSVDRQAERVEEVLRRVASSG